MHVTPLEPEGLILIELALKTDDRGFFVERYQQALFRDHGLPAAFVQDNHSRSAPRVLRGLHYQFNPAQGKLVGVIRGSIWDVAVDIRKDSPTYRFSFGVELSDRNGQMLWIPPGFAHGFCVLGEEPADVVYKVDQVYNQSGEGGIRWDDADLAIAWPISNPKVSPRDQALSSFAFYDAHQPDWKFL